MRAMRLFCYVCALAVSLSVTPAEAWDGAWYGGWGSGFVPGSAWFYHSDSVPTPPYFAIHPPVYYGRLALTYGPSERPQPPQVHGPVVWNPHGSRDRVLEVHGPQVQVQVIENPFYQAPPAAKRKGSPSRRAAAKS